MFVVVFAEQKKGGFKRVKIPLLFLGLFLTLSVISEAGPARGGFSRGGFSGRSFHAGFAPRGFNRGGRRFAFRNRGIRFQQYAWPLYWYPYGYPYDDSLDYSYLEPDSAPDYQYWDNSSGYVQPRSTNSVAPQRPVIIVINNGNARPTNSGESIDPRGSIDPKGIVDPRDIVDPKGDGGYVSNGYVPISLAGQQRTVSQNANDHSAPDPATPGDPVVPQATPAPRVQPRPGPFGKYVIVGWLQDGAKEVVSVKNIETNDVQRVTSQPNIDHLRLVEVHPSADLRQFEAIISNGSDQGAVRFQF